ncbi:MAG: sigma-70 family RNA polymerase sigma factor [Bacteroidetes bacterium]|nr:sigma-70 family RNA polymerase sigma factor [Bacteroidota bacterium]
MLLFGVCMKYLKNEDDARDGVQQVFLKIIAELHKYKVDYFKSWIYMIAKNHCLMKLRDRQGKTPVELKEQVMGIGEEESEGFRGQQHIEKDRMLDLMSASLGELSKEQKVCVTLFYLDKKSYQEIADSTGYNLGQVKSYIQNGKRNLKLLMERKLSKP